MTEIWMRATKFGWLSPVASHAGSNFQPIAMFQAEHLFPSVLRYFDSVWIADHFYGFDAAKREGFLEAWTTATWLAAKFDYVHVAHHVLGHGYRNPALTAKMASTLQILTGGRFILGIGAGWREEEFRAYGYDFPPASVRLHQLEEVVQICRKMWTEEHPTFHGTYFNIEDAVATPRPAAVPRICIGSSGESIGLPIVGRYADIWNTADQDEQSWKRKRDIVFEAATAFGRDSSEVECCLTVAGSLPESDGDSERWLQQLNGLSALGISYFVLDFGHPQNAEPAIRFAEQVITPMRRR
jgi:alkanesulfonate monooxygenase SsuD/methylene tetrahydromethanopterin reductase-like flavin-dependent oxidoreductase (luciferase family)